MDRLEESNLSDEDKETVAIMESLENHIADHIKRNPVEAEKKMNDSWFGMIPREDWNRLSDEGRRVIRERIEKSLAFCKAQLEEDGKTSISNYS